MDYVNKESLRGAFASLPLEKIAYFPSIGSTNDVVADWVREGISGPALAVADEQTEGRGRAGRRWFTPPGSALAFSLLLPVIETAKGMLGRTSGLGALAVCEALNSQYSLDAEIKWPNDVLLDGRKVCGILAEAHWSGERLNALILGIGINIAPPSVPPAKQLTFPATCVEAVLGREVERIDLLTATVASALNEQKRMHKSNFIVAWEGQLAYRGKEVHLKGAPGGSQMGELLGLEEDGSLLLKLEDGEKRSFQAGEISIQSLIDRQAK